MRRGRSGKQKELTDCVQSSNVRAFDTAGDWKATVCDGFLLHCKRKVSIALEILHNK